MVDPRKGLQSTLMQDSPLLRLPQEVLVQVMSYLSPSPQADHDTSANRYASLLNFRATCKELLTRMEDVVGEYCFSCYRCNLADQQDLEALLAISQHRTFSKTMKEIYFSWMKMQDTVCAYDLCRNHRDAVCDYDRCRRYRKHKTREVRLECKHETHCANFVWAPVEFLESYNWAIASQQTFIRNEGDASLLHTILSNFKAADNTPKIGAREEDNLHTVTSVPRALRQYRTMFDKCGYGFTGGEQDWRAFELLSGGIRSTAFPVTSLQLGSYRFGVPLTPEGFVFQGSALADLKILDITLDVSIEDKPLTLLRRNEIGLAHFISFLRECRSLETFTLSCYDPFAPTGGYDSESELFGAIADEVAGPGQALRKIQNMTLGYGLFYSLSDLLNFVRATRSTLRSLQVDSWMRFEGWSLLEDDVLKAYGGPGLKLTGYAIKANVT